MATRRFCDNCDALLLHEDDVPFIRSFKIADGRRLSAHVMIVNENGHVVIDICNKCKLHIVNDGNVGEPDQAQHKLATLQSSPAMTGGENKPLLPVPPPVTFERSKKEAKKTPPLVD